VSRHRRLAACASLALALPLAVAGAVPAVAGAAGPAAPTSSPRSAADDPAPVAPRLWAPPRVEESLYGKRQWARIGLPVRLVAGTDPIELWSNRPDYAQPIKTVVRTPDGDVALPDGSMSTFNAVDDLVAITVTDVRTGEVRFRVRRDVCLNGWGQRVRPEAPARSPYPQYCFSNPYSLGSVQGVQAGWSQPILEGTGLRLPRGRYDVTTTVAAPYAEALGLSPADASRTIRVVVSKHDHDDHDHGVEHDRAGRADRPMRGAILRDTTGPTGPTGERLEDADELEGPRPNLRSLPAWGISVSENGNFLRFAATVWNAGNSPLVVDGFVDDDEKDRMNAYQYFFDGNGDQVGYEPVGSFEFDHKATHQHWHFRDFARYTLLRADKSTAVTSRKEAFCLANTDAVDLTVPDADWSPENTDLSTDCGYEESLSMRQVLAAGWGDTYAQFRAGQSFSLKGLPNGTYYIATIANPRGRLVESSTDDNVSLRKVVIGGKEGARTVRVPKIGVIEEPTEQW
jgi:hypothetical protein